MTIKVWLEKLENGSIDLRARLIGAGVPADVFSPILNIDPNAGVIKRYRGVNPALGFQLDSEGRVVVR